MPRKSPSMAPAERRTSTLGSFRRRWQSARLVVAWVFLVVATFHARSARAVDPKADLSQYVQKRWTVAEGLSSAGVLSVCQSRDGYIWVGTEEGVSRFDGQRFTTFSARNTPAFAKATMAWNIEPDRDGSMWIATDGGLIHYRGGNDFTRIDGLSSLDVHTVAVDRDGTVWVGSFKGLDAVRDGRVVDTPEHRALAGDAIVALYADADGTLWVAARSGLHAFTGGRDRRFGSEDGLPVGHPHAIAKDKRGRLWVAVGNTVARLDGDRFVHVYGDPARLEDETRAIYVDTHDTVWLGRRDGLHALGPERRTTFDRSWPLAGEMVRGMVEDREGNLWVVAYGGGLFLFQDAAFRTWNPEEKNVISFGALAATDGSVWMGALSGNIYRQKDGQLTRYPPREGLANDAVWSLYEDPAHTIWVGSGALRKITARGPVAADDRPHTAATVTRIVTSRSGGMWVGTLGEGLRRWVDGTYVEEFHVTDGLPTEEVTSVLEARDGTLWIGTRDGLVRRTDGRITAVPLGDDSFNATISDLEEDPDGSIWIAAFGGLARYENGHALVFSPSAGFPFLTNSVTLDGLGNVWTGTNTGICRVPLEFFRTYAERRAPAPSYRCFDEADGIRNRETSMGGRSVTHLPDGRLGFATAAGLAMVDPKQIASDGLEPLVVVQEVDADGASLGTKTDPILSPGTRQLRIDYAALTYVAPARVRYRYRLEGYDRDWVEAADRRSAHYTNLAPGAYRFVVIAENGRGVWNSAGASLRIRQRAYFYQTPVFYAVSTLAVAALVAVAFRLRVRRLEQTAATLERSVTEKTVELRTALAELEEKDERLHTDLVRARAFQRAMLPNIRGTERIQFAALYHSAELVGGDIYDITELGGGAFRVFLADTTGHGVQASLQTMVLKAEYDRLKSSASTPSRLLEALNAVLIGSAERRIMCTACCVDVTPDPRGGARVVYSNAAHLELLHLSRAGDATTLYTPGMYLGVTAESQYGEIDARLAPGDSLLLYSDGAVDETNASGAMFGTEGLARELRLALARCSSLADALATVKLAVETFRPPSAASQPLADDMTLVLIHISDGGDKARA